MLHDGEWEGKDAGRGWCWVWLPLPRSRVGELQRWEPLLHWLGGLAATQKLWVFKQWSCQVSHQLPSLEDKSKSRFLPLSRGCLVAELQLGLSVQLLVQ